MATILLYCTMACHRTVLHTYTYIYIYIYIYMVIDKEVASDSYIKKKE